MAQSKTRTWADARFPLNLSKHNLENKGEYSSAKGFASQNFIKRCAAILPTLPKPGSPERKLGFQELA
jgi:hypothetical protein